MTNDIVQLSLCANNFAFVRFYVCYWTNYFCKILTYFLHWRWTNHCQGQGLIWTSPVDNDDDDDTDNDSDDDETTNSDHHNDYQRCLYTTHVHYIKTGFIF